MFAQVLHVLVSLHAVVALDNGVGLYPPMGYNTWNDLGCRDMTEANVKMAADALVNTGLLKAGFEFVNLDDCWQADTRNSTTGRLEGHPERFPSGIKALADYLHENGFKFGIYTDRGTKTCAGYPGSFGHEDIDAQTFADWGVDYVKEDNCHSSTGANDLDTLFAEFGKFRDALNKTGRPIFFSVCGGGDQWPLNDIRYYATDSRGGAKLANSWRITPDVIGRLTLQDASLTNAGLADYAGPGGFNDPDMLLSSSNTSVRQLPVEWSRTQFSVWAVLMAPLLIGGPPEKLDPFDIETYTNAEVIAVNQDPLMKQGTIVEKSGIVFLPQSHVIWARNLSGGSVAMVFVNDGWATRDVTCGEKCWSALPFKKGTRLTVRDLWAHAPAEAPIAIAGTPYSVFVAGFWSIGDSRMFKLTPVSRGSERDVRDSSSVEHVISDLVI